MPDRPAPQETPERVTVELWRGEALALREYLRDCTYRSQPQLVSVYDRLGQALSASRESQGRYVISFAGGPRDETGGFADTLAPIRDEGGEYQCWAGPDTIDGDYEFQWVPDSSASREEQPPPCPECDFGVNACTCELREQPLPVSDEELPDRIGGYVPLTERPGYNANPTDWVRYALTLEWLRGRSLGAGPRLNREQREEVRIALNLVLRQWPEDEQPERRELLASAVRSFVEGDRGG